MTNNINNKPVNRKNKRNRIDIFDICIVVVFCIIAVITVTKVPPYIKGFLYPAEVNRDYKLDLKERINDGDIDAMVTYYDNYISRDVYLYDDSFTIKACCQKYNLNEERITEDYNNSNYYNLQEYFNNEIKK